MFNFAKKSQTKHTHPHTHTNPKYQNKYMILKQNKRWRNENVKNLRKKPKENWKNLNKYGHCFVDLYFVFVCTKQKIVDF